MSATMLLIGTHICALQAACTNDDDDDDDDDEDNLINYSGYNACFEEIVSSNVSQQ